MLKNFLMLFIAATFLSVSDFDAISFSVSLGQQAQAEVTTRRTRRRKKVRRKRKSRRKVKKSRRRGKAKRKYSKKRRRKKRKKYAKRRGRRKKRGRKRRGKKRRSGRGSASFRAMVRRDLRRLGCSAPGAGFNRPGARSSCHGVGKAVDIGKLTCGGKTRSIWTSKGRKKNTSFFSKKARQFRNMGYSVIWHKCTRTRRRKKTITSCHKDHIHMSKCCTTLSGRRTC